MTDKRRQTINYALIILALAMFSFVAQGMANATKSQYVKPICDTFGWARTQLTLGMSISDLVMFIGNLLFAALVSRLGGMRNALLLASLSIVGTYVVYYMADSLLVFYVGYILYGIAEVFMNTAGYTVIVDSWFVEKKGTVLGLVFAGNGLGAVIWNLVAGSAISNQGWRTGYLYTAICAAVLCAIAILLVRNKPTDKGMTPYGAERLQKDVKEQGKTVGFMLQEVLREPFFWIVGFAITLLMMCVFGVYINAAGHLGNLGVSQMSIASLMSLSYVFATLAKIFGGMLIDKFGIKKVLACSVASYICGTFILSSYKVGMPMTRLYIYVVFFGFGLITTSVAIPMIAHKVFGNKDLAAIMGVTMAFFSVGGVLAGPSASMVYDLIGSYAPAFYAYTVLAVIAVAMLFLSMNMSRKKLQSKENL